MGGGYYDRDVSSPSSSSSGGYDYSSYSDTASKAMGSTSMDSALSPSGRTLETDSESPVVLATDVTGSMGDWPKIIYDKMPMFYGQLMLQNYLKNPAVSFAAIGDANSDSAPLQVCDFDRGTTLDDWLKKIYIEGGGGGGGRESYEVAADFYGSDSVKIPKAATPFFFFTGDEGFYPETPATVANKVLGPRWGKIDAAAAFRALRKKFEVFLIHKDYGSSDAQVVAQWGSVIDRERILVLEDPKSIVDVILGAIALVSQSRDLDAYAVDMKGRGQTKSRIDSVRATLGQLGQTTALAKVDARNLPSSSPGGRRQGGKRI